MPLAIVTNYMPDQAPQPSPAELHAQWIEEIAASQSKVAFANLFDYFAPRIKAMMIKSGSSPELAEDLVQMAMMNVWRRSPQFKADRGSASAWIYTIARNARIDHLRKGASAPYAQIDDMEIADDNPSAEDHTYASERADAVRAAIAKVPSEQREVLELAFHQDVSHGVIAKRLKIPLGTVKSRLRLAYAKLKTELEVIK